MRWNWARANRGEDIMKRFQALLRASSAIGVIFATPALSQTPPVEGDQAAETEAGPSEGIVDIVVTARRREEALQSTPVTVTAFSAAELESRGIDDLRSLAQATPGINFDAFPRSAPRPFFRGIGSGNQGAGGDPSSVAFLDGVYLGRSAMLGIDFYDMQRIEVLKGPQGTLFGKNVVGGAVNFITAKPVADRAASVQITAGEFKQLDAHAMVNLPITDGIATRIVLGAVSNDGFRRTADGRNLDDENKLSARMQTIFGLGSATTFLLSGDYAEQDTAPGARYNVRVLTPRRTFTLPNGTKQPQDFDDVSKPRVANPDNYGGIKTHTGGLRGELVTEALGFASLTATAAWRNVFFDSLEDVDGTTAAQNAANGVAFSGSQAIQREKADSYSGEVRLNSLGDGPLSWVLGLYTNHDDIWRQRETQPSATPTTINEYTATAKTRSYAAYGEAQYRFDFGLGVFAGARYTDEKKKYEITRLTGPRTAPVVNYTTVGSPGVARDKLVTYRVGADYRFNENIFAFGSVSTGFKAGAFPEQPSTAILARTPTAPEEVTNYEIGLKTDWLNRRLRFNISGFIAKYKDFQTIQVINDARLGPGANFVSTDTGDATIKGVETELVVAPTKWIDLTARYTHLDATFDRLTQTSAILANGTPVFRDLAGMRLSRTPKHALNTALGFTSPRAEWGWLSTLVVMDYQSRIFDDNDNDFLEYRRPRTLWDASVTYHVDDRISVQAWVRNLTDKEYRTHQVDSANGLFVQYGPPRQFGVTFNSSF